MTHRTIDEAVNASVNEDGKATSRVWGLLAQGAQGAQGAIGHNGTLASMVEKTQLHWIPRDGSGRPLKRHEIEMNLAKFDAQVDPRVRDEMFRKLDELGLFEHRYVPSRKQYDTVLWHGNHLDSIFYMWMLLVHTWQSGVRFKKVVNLSAYVPVHEGSSDSIATLRRLCLQHKVPFPTEAGQEGQPGDYTSHVGMVHYLWKQLTLADMQDKVELHVVSAADPIGPDGTDVRANTNHTVSSWYESGAFDTHDEAYLLLSCAPFALRQYLITRTFFRRKGMTKYILDAIAAPYSGKRSLTICKMEFAKFLFEQLEAHSPGH